MNVRIFSACVLLAPCSSFPLCLVHTPQSLPHTRTQIIVLDAVTLEDVGTKHGFAFSVHRVDYNRSIKYRVAKLQVVT